MALNMVDVIEHFNNVVCEIKANLLHSFYIARTVHYLQLSTRNHNREHIVFVLYIESSDF